MTAERDILIIGGQGQVGIEVRRARWPAGVRLVCPGRSTLDLTDQAAVTAFIGDHHFSAVVNCSAWTAVDLAETEVAAAFLANCQGPANLSEVTGRLDIPLVHVSTDYVFDGSLDRPYREIDSVGPLGVYGASKLAGELAISSGNPRSVILRTAWVLSPHRSNFLKTMLRLASSNPTIRIVADQHGCPTSAKDIASALVTITTRLMADGTQAPSGVFNFVNAGEATWFELASHIFACSTALGGPTAALEAICSDQYPTPAQRPANSRLDTAKIQSIFGIQPRDWREAVSEIVAEALTITGTTSSR